MKHLCVTLIVCLLVGSAGIAQTTQTNQTAGLQESRDLTAKVIKLFGEGKFEEARPLAKRALELREKALGPDHQDLIPLLLNLGEISKERKKFEEAQSYFSRALRLSEKAFGADDIRVARTLDRLAVTYEWTGDKSAEETLIRSLAIKEKALGPDDRELAPTLYYLGEINQGRGDNEKAAALYQRAVQLYEREPEKNQADLLKVLRGYGSTLAALNKVAEAQQIESRIAELAKRFNVIEGGVLNGRAISLGRPEYPPLARGDRASGMVRVQVLIDETGKVISARAVDPGNTHMTLVNAAVLAAQKSVFSPTLLSGKPVKVHGIIVYSFIAE